ncbi:Vascular endothelial growth factor D [Apodemus speciosus]|uniref:Vascular endothelial growth factor D n=1 Tax=Apodemus speciosus TaxID=105296 RepID=A0ABQ0FVM0_APOSI
MRSSQSVLERSEQQIRAASSLEELLQIAHSEDWKLWRCRLKLKGLASMDSRSTSHRSTRFAATFYDTETLKVIDEEWQRTQCSPRETCVEVASELGKTTNTFFKPPCVNVFRCGGCCNEESVMCMNTSTSYISKQLFEISVPLTSVPELVPVKIANHTGCKCLPTAPRHPYSIIRRSIQIPEEDQHPQKDMCWMFSVLWSIKKQKMIVEGKFSGERKRMKRRRQRGEERGEVQVTYILCTDEYECPHSKKLCPIDMLWDNTKCKCVLQDETPLPGTEDHSYLQEPALCGPHMTFDEDRCECVCKAPCPGDLIQHPENCSCFECKESVESCCQKHKIFHPDTCSPSSAVPSNFTGGGIDIFVKAEPAASNCEDRCPFHTRTCASRKPACGKHWRFPKETRAQGLHSQENP